MENKKLFTILGIVAVVVALYYLFFKDKNNSKESSYLVCSSWCTYEPNLYDIKTGALVKKERCNCPAGTTNRASN
jgi:hypothetical protein